MYSVLFWFNLINIMQVALENFGGKELAVETAESFYKVWDAWQNA
jgi:hypothetical protein